MTANGGNAAALGDGNRSTTPGSNRRSELFTESTPTPSDLQEASREYILPTLRMRADAVSATLATPSALPTSDVAFASAVDAATNSGRIAAGWDAAVDRGKINKVLAMAHHAVSTPKSAGQACGAPSTPGASDLASVGGAPSTPGSDEDVEVETLSDVDDDELDSLYLLGEQEAQQKADVWHEVNKDYLEEWYIRSREAKRRKEERAAATAAAETGSSTSRRSRRSQRYPKCDSAAQAAALGLERRGGVGTDRVNMAALNSLFDM